MTDYTPSTQDVLDAYKGQLIQTGDHSYELIDENQAIAEFSRWLVAERKRVAEMAQKRLLSKITRVTLVDDDRGGIQYERYDIQVEPSIQDNGKTLKLFIKGNSPKVS